MHAHTHTHKHSRMKNVYALEGDLDKVVFAVEVEPGGIIPVLPTGGQSCWTVPGL